MGIGRGTGRAGTAAGTAALVLGLLAGCGQGDVGDQPPAVGAPPFEVSDAPAVAAVAPVVDLITKHAFTVDAPEPGPPLLVIHDGGVPLVEGEAVSFTGQLRPAFDRAAVDDELVWADNPLLFAAFDGEPYVLATAVRPAP